MLTHAMTTSEVTWTKCNITEMSTELNTDPNNTILHQRGLKRKWRNFVFVRVSILHDPDLSVFKHAHYSHYGTSVLTEQCTTPPPCCRRVCATGNNKSRSGNLRCRSRSNLRHMCDATVEQMPHKIHVSTRNASRLTHWLGNNRLPLLIFSLHGHACSSCVVMRSKMREQWDEFDDVYGLIAGARC